jgi:hypothetical protein
MDVLSISFFIWMGISFIASFVRKVDYLFFCVFPVACRMDIILHSFVGLMCCGQACECVAGMFWIYLLCLECIFR